MMCSEYGNGQYDVVIISNDYAVGKISSGNKPDFEDGCDSRLPQSEHSPPEGMVQLQLQQVAAGVDSSAF